MTARLIFEATLIELSKLQAPSLKLYEFNYLFNKAINQYINKVYNIYDVNLLTTDDLRVLKSTCFLDPTKVKSLKVDNPNSATENTKRTASSYLSRAHSLIQSLNGATYEVFLPMDYLHLLNCVCIFYVAKQKDCWDEGSYIQIPATRLTADSWSQILTDIYNRPSPMKPYYYIHNRNTSKDLPTNPYNEGKGTDMEDDYQVTSNEGGSGFNVELSKLKIVKEGTLYNKDGESTNDFEKIDWGITFSKNEELCVKSEDKSNFPRTFNLNGNLKSVVEKPIASRIGNASTARCEIRYGWDDSVFLLVEVLIDYVKVPQFIRLTQEQIDLTEDTSQIMEFPDYVNQEIINELVHLVMERTADPRLSTNILMTQSIARPTGQLQQTLA